MKIVKVSTAKHSTQYEILIGISLQKIAEDILNNFSGRKIFIITDNNVKKLYGEKFLNYLKKGNADVYLISFKAGEQSKNRKTKEYLEDKLIDFGANRTSLIVALGGGVVGDLAGFTAATLFRGVQFIQVPTTLIAQVDSSIGGKVGLNHPSGKNLIGAFYQPNRVLIDPTVLKTLSDSEYLNGVAEIIKYAASLDSKLFEYLYKKLQYIKKPNSKILENLIYWCCNLKAIVVNKDEKETSYRRILNFGHSIGHALEILSDYKIPHGYAIATGMAVEADFSVRLGLMQKKEADRLKNLLLKFGYQVTLPEKYSVDDYLDALQTDKKSDDYGINFTLLKKIGKAEINIQLNNDDIKTLLMFYDLR